MAMLAKTVPVEQTTTLPCDICTHAGLCKYEESMRKLAVEPRYDLPELIISIGCRKYEGGKHEES